MNLDQLIEDKIGELCAMEKSTGKAENKWPGEFNLDDEPEAKGLGFQFLQNGAKTNHKSSGKFRHSSFSFAKAEKEMEQLFALDSDDSVYDSSN